MIPDLSPVFARYEALRDEADALFARVDAACPGCVVCRRGCSDCCHALFDLSFVEAMYINRAFAAALDYGPERSRILSGASEADRRLARLKRDLYRAEKAGEPAEAIMERAAKMRMPCPLLDAEAGLCILYDSRPITCRLYGVPTAIGGRGHVCGFSGFKGGGAYPTVHLDKIQARLETLSREAAEALGSRFSEIAQVYVPLSMALLTSYDANYLGIRQARSGG